MLLFSLRHAGGREFMMIYIIISYFCYHIFSSSFAVLKPTPIYLMDINALNNQIVEKITYLFKYEFLYRVRPILKLHVFKHLTFQLYDIIKVLNCFSRNSLIKWRA